MQGNRQGWAGFALPDLSALRGLKTGCDIASKYFFDIRLFTLLAKVAVSFCWCLTLFRVIIFWLF